MDSGTGSTYTFTDDGTLVMGPSGLLSGAAGFTLASGATLVIGSATGIPGNITVTGATSYNTGANYTFNGTAAQVTSATMPATVHNLTINNSAGVTLSQAATVSGTLTVTSGTFTVGAVALTVTGATSVSGTLAITSTTGAKHFGAVTVNSGGTWANSANSAVTISGSLANSGTFTAGTGVYTASGSGQTISGTMSIPSLTVTGTYQNNGTLTVGTALAGAGTLTQGANATLNIGGTSTITTLTATAGPNLVDYTGVAQTVKAVAYDNLTLSGSGAKTMNTGTAVSGDLSIAPTGGGATASLGAGLTLTVGTLTLGGTTQVSGTWGGTGSGASHINTTYFAASSGKLNVTTSGATKLVYTTVPSTGMAGTPFSVTVQSQDALGNPAYLSSATTITLSKATGGGSLSGTLTGTILSGADSVTISTPVYSMSDTMTLTATASGGVTLTAVTSGNIVFSPGVLSQLVMIPATIASATAGTSVSSSFTSITAEDANGNVCSSGPNAFTGTVTFGGTAGATGTSVAFTAGVLSAFPALTPTHAGSGKTVTATSGSIVGTTTITTVNPGAVSQLVMNPTTIASATVGTSVSSSFTSITAEDANGNVCSSGPNAFTGTVTFGGTAGATGTSVAFTAGVLSAFPALTPTVAGSGKTVTATSGSIVGTTTITTVNPAAASKLVFTTTAVTVTAGVASGTITVQRQDPYNNPNTADAARTVTLSSTSSGTVTFTPASPLTIALSSSSASFTYTDTKAGTPTVTAASTSPTTITPATQVETVNPGTANKLAFTTQPPANTTAGSNMVSFVVQVEDTCGNAVADNGAVVTLTPSSGSIYSGATATTAVGGAATFSSTVIWTAETGIDFAASVTSPSLSGTSGAFNITPECSAGETTKGYSINYVTGTAYIGFTNQYGLGSVVGLRLTNCTMTAQAYGAGGVPLGSPLSLPDNAIGGSYVALPAGTTNVLCTATKINGSLPANANAIVKNLCGTFALQLDPVTARLEIAGGGQAQLIFTNVPAAERFISVQNGSPGLTKLTLLVNGQSFVLSPLGAGSSKSLDVGAAMNPGNANVVVLLGEGADGASATLAMADSPTGDATMVGESIALQIETSAQGPQLSWPIAGAGYLLQSRSSSGPGDAWVNWPGAAESVNGRWVVPLPPGDPARFFRLYYQP